MNVGTSMRIILFEDRYERVKCKAVEYGRLKRWELRGSGPLEP